MNQKPTHKSIFMLEEGTHLDTVCSRDGTGCSGAGWTIKQGKFVGGEDEMRSRYKSKFVTIWSVFA